MSRNKWILEILSIRQNCTLFQSSCLNLSSKHFDVGVTSYEYSLRSFDDFMPLYSSKDDQRKITLLTRIRCFVSRVSVTIDHRKPNFLLRDVFKFNYLSSHVERRSHVIRSTNYLRVQGNAILITQSTSDIDQKLARLPANFTKLI